MHFRLPAHTILDVVYTWLFANDKLKQASFHLGISEHSIVEWYHSCRTTVAKLIDDEPKFVGTEECPIQIDEACIAGMAKYNKGRRLSVDDAEETDEGLPEWYKGDSDDEADATDAEHVRFGEDVSSWRRVVGIHNGKSLV